MKLRPVSTAVLLALVAALMPLGAIPAGASNHGPKITSAALVVDAGGNNKWKNVGDVMRIRWSERATHADGRRLSEGEVSRLLGRDVDFARGSRVIQSGDGTRTWRLTIEGRRLGKGVRVGQAVNGTGGNASVRDRDGNRQRAARGEKLLDRVRPTIVSAALVADADSDNLWDAAGDAIRLKFTEPVTHSDSTALSAAELTALLGRTVTLAGGSRVTQAGDGTRTWTLTISGAQLTAGVAVGAVVDGSRNPNVTDAAGNSQARNAAVTLDDLVRPEIAAAGLTADAGNDRAWTAPGDVLRVTFTEPVTHSGDGTLDATELSALLGRTIALGGATVTQLGDGTDTWTLSVAGGTLTTGIANDAAVNGTSNGRVKDDAGNSQAAASGVTMQDILGPQIVRTAIVTDVDFDEIWDADGDILRVFWTEGATHAATETTLSEAQVEAVLGADITPATATVKQLNDGTATWDLEIDTAAMTTGVALDAATLGTANSDVTDAAGNAQRAATGVSLDEGPVITSVALTNDGGTADSWNAVGDVLTVTFTENATHAGDATLDETEIEDLLDTTIEFGTTPASTVNLVGSGTPTWTLTIADGALTEGIIVTNGANGKNNPNVTDDAGNPQVATTGIPVSDDAPLVLTKTLLSSDSDGDGSWDASGDVLQITWNESGTKVGGTSLSQTEVNALLGTAVQFSGATTVTLSGAPGPTWSLTVGGGGPGQMTTGLPVNTATPGTPNGIATDGATGNTQVATSGVLLDRGPVIIRTALVEDDGDGEWSAINDKMRIWWSEDADHTGIDDGMMEASDVDDWLGATVTAQALLNDITFAGNGTDEWTLTITDDPLTAGLTANDLTATPGANFATVTGADGAPQVKTSGVVFGRGPKINAVSITTDDGPGTSWNEVGDVLAVNWDENAFHAADNDSDGNATLTEAEVEAILNTAIGFGTSPASVVNLAGSGTQNWTLTIVGGDLGEGIASSDPANGTNNASVVDSAGRPQLLTTGETVLDGVSPEILRTSLAVDSDDDGIWDAPTDKLRILWNEATSHTGISQGGTISEAEIEAVLGNTSLAFDTGGTPTTVTLNYSTGTALAGAPQPVWFLTINTTAMTTGLTADSAQTSGTNNAAVTDAANNPQVVSTPAVSLGMGPKLVSVALTTDSGNVNDWRDAGDVLTVLWSEPATHAGDTTFDATELTALLGNTVTGGSATQTGDGTDEWTLTLDTGGATNGVAVGESVNGTNNSNVTDGGGHFQVARAALTAGDTSGPLITAVTQTVDTGRPNEWDAVGDSITITWTEGATHSAPDTALTEEEVEDVLGTMIESGTDPASTFTQGGDGTTSWTIVIGANALTEGVDVGDAVNGTVNGDVVDASNNIQQMATGEALIDAAGPFLVSTGLTTDTDNDGEFDAKNDVMTLRWNEPTTVTGDTSLTDAEFEAIVGATVTFAQDGVTTITVGGDGTQTWTLTIGGAVDAVANLSEGVDVGDATNGTPNAHADDLANNTQIPAPTAVVLGIGPKVTGVDLLSDPDGNNSWDKVGDKLRITWSEAANHNDADGNLSEADVEEVLGLGASTVNYGGSTVVTLTNDETAIWTLTISGGPMTSGLASGTATVGSRNTDVTDADGNNQMAGASVTVQDGPRITAALLSTDTDIDNRWDAVGDRMSVSWSEIAPDGATHAPGGTPTDTLTEAQVEAVLGTDVEFATGGSATTVTIEASGQGTNQWVLVIGGSDMVGNNGVAKGDAVLGTDNTNVVDSVGAPQLARSGGVSLS